jgi:hypothetical protein
MAPTDVLRLSALLDRACKIYNRPFSPDLVDAYADVLDGTPITTVEQAAAAHFKTSRFFPAPVDLLSVGGETSLRIEAGEDWALLKRGKDARHNPVVASDAINLVGGHMMLRDLLIADEPHRRREFIDAYLACAREDAIESSLKALAESRRTLPA